MVGVFLFLCFCLTVSIEGRGGELQELGDGLRLLQIYKCNPSL